MVARVLQALTNEDKRYTNNSTRYAPGLNSDSMAGAGRYPLAALLVATALGWLQLYWDVAARIVDDYNRHRQTTKCISMVLPMQHTCVLSDLVVCRAGP